MFHTCVYLLFGVSCWVHSNTLAAAEKRPLSLKAYDRVCGGEGNRGFHELRVVRRAHTEFLDSTPSAKSCSYIGFNQKKGNIRNYNRAVKFFRFNCYRI